MSRKKTPPPEPDPSEPLRPSVTINHAMKMVGVSRRTIYNWLRAGKVDYIRTAGGSVRIYTDTLWQADTDEPKVEP